MFFNIFAMIFAKVLTLRKFFCPNCRGRSLRRKSHNSLPSPIYITKKHLGVSALSTIPKDSERPVILGEYIIEHKATVRQAASEFGISKSTVHKDVSERLKKVKPSLYKEVRVILDINKQERHIRGGEATKQKYKELSGIK